MLADLVAVQPAPKYGEGAFGLFAKLDIPSGTPVWWDAPASDGPYRLFTRREVMEHPQRELLARYSYMLRHDTYASTTDPAEDTGYYFNHSCDGPCWYDSDSRVVTKRDVKAGEELTYDYALTETEASLHAGMQCSCGGAKCRGTLLFDQWRDPVWMAENAGHTSDFIARKAVEVGWHHSAVYLVRKRPSTAEGDGGDKGLFTMQDIRKGETLLYFGGKVVGRNEFLKTQKLLPTMHFLQVAPQLWMVPTKDGSETPDHINHSCDPNCGMLDSVTVVAMRDIAAGEELFIDYATVMDETLDAEELERFECLCGKPVCRGFVTPRDYCIPELQIKYTGFFPPFMQAKVDTLKADEAVATSTP